MKCNLQCAVMHHMNIKEALELTQAKNKKQLGEYLGLSVSAVYQWDEQGIPLSAVGLILTTVEKQRQSQQETRQPHGKHPI